MYLCVLASWGCHNKLPQTWWCKWQKFILKVWRPKVWSQGVTKLCPLPSLWIKSIPPLTCGGMISLHHVSTGDGSDLRTLQIFALVHWTDGDQTYEPSIVITKDLEASETVTQGEAGREQMSTLHYCSHSYDRLSEERKPAWRRKLTERAFCKSWSISWVLKVKSQSDEGCVCACVCVYKMKDFSGRKGSRLSLT